MFENDTSLYVADTGNTASYHVLYYTSPTVGTWTLYRSIYFGTTAPIYSVTGRSESGSFVVYACTSTTLYAYTAATNSVRSIATTSTNMWFRGVVLPPVGALFATATPYPTRTSTVTATSTASNTATATGSLTTTATTTSSPSSTTSSSASLSGGAPPSNTPSNTASSSTTATQQGTQSATRSISLTASNTATSSGTSTHTPSIPPTPTQTPGLNVFYASNVLVLRVGTASTAGFGPGIAQPVFIEEYDTTLPNRVPASILEMSTLQCTLGVGKATAAPWVWWDSEGFPSISTDGTLVAFPCNAVAVGNPIGTSSSTSTSVRTIATVSYDGTTSTTTSMTYPYGGTSTIMAGFHSVATVSGASFYTSFSPGYNPSGVNTFPYSLVSGGVAASGFGSAIQPYGAVGSPGDFDARCVGIFSGQRESATLTHPLCTAQQAPRVWPRCFRLVLRHLRIAPPPPSPLVAACSVWHGQLRGPGLEHHLHHRRRAPHHRQFLHEQTVGRRSGRSLDVSATPCAASTGAELCGCWGGCHGRRCPLH